MDKIPEELWKHVSELPNDETNAVLYRWALGGNKMWGYDIRGMKFFRPDLAMHVARNTFFIILNEYEEIPQETDYYAVWAGYSDLPEHQKLEIYAEHHKQLKNLKTTNP